MNQENWLTKTSLNIQPSLDHLSTNGVTLLTELKVKIQLGLYVKKYPKRFLSLRSQAMT
jgi:hypothetical protein